MCQLFNFFLLGGNPLTPTMPNTDPVSITLLSYFKEIIF